MRLTRLETTLVQPKGLYLKMHVDAGLFGHGEPVVEGWARTVRTAVQEREENLNGRDPRRIEPHWQAISHHASCRGATPEGAVRPAREVTTSGQRALKTGVA